MKIREFECNVCHKRADRAFCFVGVAFNMAKRCEVLESDNVFAEDIHFCNDCARRVIEEILTSMGENPKEKVGKKETTKRPKKRERLDAGKVMALHRAGWDNEKIADEMGVTERQIYQCIRYQIKKMHSGSEPDGKEQGNEK